MLKSEIREIRKKERKALSPEQIQEKSLLLTENFWKSSFLENLSVLHLFLPIKKFNEPNTWLLIRKIWQEKTSARLVVSRTNIQTQSLEHYFLEPNTFLQENAWGICEPDEKTGRICPIEQIQVILVPLLAFDKRGFRVGYGKGFYDRFLAQCPEAIKIGFSMEEVLPELISDIDKYDVALDYCITPTQMLSFAKS
ncbi:MAG: 5-formyltetrahydrofolate cyclo-ligase [Raineya sp.]